MTDAIPYTEATRTEGATFRITLTDYLGNVTEQVAESQTEWLAISNKALRANRFHPQMLEGKSGPKTQQPLYVRCESSCVLPDGTEVGCGGWTKREAIEPGPKEAAPDDEAALAELARLLPGLAVA